MQRKAEGLLTRILAAAASLGAERGFDAISMADIGAEAGIVGSGVYRHFGSKTAILVAMADRVMDRLMARCTEILAAGLDERQSLTLLVRDHIEVARPFTGIETNTAYSFGLDDQEFVVAFDADDPAEFLDLVQELRATESSAYTESETPIFTCIRSSVERALDALDGEAVRAPA